jgi:hypothetical protein
VRDHETLKGVEDKEMETELREAAEVLKAAPDNLKAVILKAAARGENANKITEAIGFVYSPDYVRRLIREGRKKGKIPPRD